MRHEDSLYRFTNVSHKSRWHFLKQLFDRYGIILEGNEYNEILFKIRYGYSKVVRRDRSRNSETHLVFMERLNRFIRVVYSLESDLLITCVPMHHGTLMGLRPDQYVDGHLPYYQRIVNK